MALAFSKEYSTFTKHRRAISSAVISLVLLLLIALNSSFLFSYPDSSVIPSYFDGSERTTRVDLRLSWEGKIDSEGKADLEESTELVQTSEHTPSHSTYDQLDIKRPLPSQDNYPEVHEAINITLASREIADDSECDLYRGEWYYDAAGPLYTNSSCPILTQSQNCQGNGRPDKEYENWRWRPSDCDLQRFNATQFLELMRGKTIAFVGDSLARNQMESLMCILWQVEAPVNRGSRKMQRWIFKSHSFTIIRVWSAWLVDTSKTLGNIPEWVAQIHLDVPDDAFMSLVETFDVVVLCNGHWFSKSSAYLSNNEIVGTQSWSPPKEMNHHQPMNITNIEAFEITTQTSLTALATHANYSGLTILTSYSPDHYENGAWNTGGSCTGKVRPLLPGQEVKHEFTNIMHEKQVMGFNAATKSLANGSKLKLMDITGVFGYRHDGHPGPYRSLDPNKITKRGPNGRPPSQDCLHWCMPGPVDVWNDLMFEIIRREFDEDS